MVQRKSYNQHGAPHETQHLGENASHGRTMGGTYWVALSHSGLGVELSYSQTVWATRANRIWTPAGLSKGSRSRDARAPCRLATATGEPEYIDTIVR